MARFVGLTNSINIPTAHSTVKLNSCHYNWHIHTPFTPTLTPHSQSIPLIPISLWQGPPTETLIYCYNSWQLCKRGRQISQEQAKWYFFNTSSVCLWRSYTNILSCWCLSGIDRVQGQFQLFLPDSECLTECSVTVKGTQHLAGILFELVTKKTYKE